MSRYKLALTLQAQGRSAEAEKEFQEVLRLRTDVLGQDHPYTLECRNRLADEL